MVSFRNKREKEHLLEKARKMEEYASMIVECIEESKSDDYDYDERYYRGNDEDMEMKGGRYGYRRNMR